MTEQSRTHELLLEAAGRLLEAEPNFDLAYRTLENSRSGYRADTLPSNNGGGDSTHPERYAAINGDLANTALAELKHHTRLAFASAAAIARIVNAWIPNATPSKSAPTFDPQDWCSSCLRIGKCSPRHRGDRCRWCYDFQTAYHREPPIELVRDHHEGRRISEERIKDALRIRAS